MSKFEIFKEEIIEHSESDNFWEAIEEWRFINLLDGGIRSKARCICTTPIRYEYEIRNENNSNKLIVGSVCIGIVYERGLDEGIWFDDNSAPLVVKSINSVAKILASHSKKIIAFGKHQGKTFKELLLENPDYSEWFCTNTSTPPKKKLSKKLKNMQSYRKFVRVITEE